MSNIEILKPTICLNMIVKNEAHIIKRCLESVKPHIHSWVIADTGSTDGTQSLIREIMQDVPGELIEREWVNFGHNRDEVLQHSNGKSDYILNIDADEWLEFEDEIGFKNLNADSYYIIKDQGNKHYWVRNIIKNDMGWKWHGVLHEYLQCQDSETYGDLNHVVIQARQEGARSKDPDTYRKDAAILTKALIDEPQNTRYQFYLAQSLRDAKDYEAAILHYKRRIEMDGWDEEIFYSKYQIAILMERLDHPWEECLNAYLTAWEHTPERAEPLYRIGSYYLENKNWPLAWLFLNQAANLKRKEEFLLFIEEQIYEYMALFDATVAAGNLGYWEEMEERHEKLLQIKNLDEDNRSLAIQNYEYFQSIKAEMEKAVA